MKPTRMAVVRDVILFVFGLAGIGYQTVTGKVDIALLIVFTTMVGTPGLTNLISVLRGSDTESPSLPPASQPPASESECAS